MSRVAQRLGWVAMLLIVVAIGVLGSGPLARTEARGRGVRVDYDRFSLWGTPTTLRVAFAEMPTTRGVVSPADGVVLRDTGSPATLVIA